jgi:quercetin dioxygenase-like cupin family protein
MSEQTYPIKTDEVEWTDPTVSFYPAGVKEKILWENPETGAIIALIKYPAGSMGIAHTHPEANEAGYALEGEVEDQDGNRISYKGLFSVNPKGVEHSGGVKFTKDSVILLSWDGPR